MAWGLGLLALLKALPDIIKALKLLGELAEAGHHAVVVHISLQKFDEATEKAKNDKDTSKLEDIFNPPPPSQL